jgi:nucleotide-binding universal stress UspA family protein
MGHQAKGVAMMNTVILALDGAESQRAVPVAKDLADRFRAKIVVVHVNEFVVGGRGAGCSVRVDESDVQRDLERLVEELRAGGIDIELEVATAPADRAARAIADSATRHKAGMIVVATRGHHPITGLLAGSVTQRLLHKAPCPVLAVPPPARAAAAAA